MATNIFEYATRNKIRFQSSKGELSVEQLWDVPLRSRDDFNLNSIAKAASDALKSASEENFVETARTPAHDRLEIVLEIVKHVIGFRLDQEEAAKKRADNRAKKELLLKALSEKQAGRMSEMSEKELQRQIAALDE